MDLKPLYDYTQHIYTQIYHLYDVLSNKEVAEISTLRTQLKLPNDKKINFALCQRLINLKEEPILHFIREDQQKKRLIFDYVSTFYQQKFEEILSYVNTHQLLTPFYRALLQGTHAIGLHFNAFFLQWNATLIEGFNAKVKDPQLKQTLISSIDKLPTQLQGERSYSIPQQCQDTLEFLTYAQAFEIPIKQITQQIQLLIDTLSPLQDSQKPLFLDYFTKLKEALNQTNRSLLIQKWQEADEAWSVIDSPIQIVHPMEYYQDIYRHSVAPEWDIRLQNPYCQTSSMTKQNIINLFYRYNSHHLPFPKTLENVKFYDCIPLFFYGSLNNGLFSAQVIPNDESIPQKKIFAYTQRILDSLQNKPLTKLETQIFPAEFLQDYQALLANPTQWKAVYDISTNGHEYGHILWVDSSSESQMNAKGEFKNLEEFKATASGLVAYFQSQHTPLLKEVILDHLHRSIKLISYQKVFEVLPYYCEGLLHLSGAFESGVLDFQDTKLHFSWDKLPNYIQWYQEIYASLVEFYCAKKESSEFLFAYLYKQEEVYLPQNAKTKEFVLYYFDLYEKIGQEVL